jgi:hypothetical protein
LLGFDLETYQIPLVTLMPSKRIPDGVMSTRKYKQIVSSIHEIGLIEPLSVIQHDPAKSEFILLDGHRRVQALKDLGVHKAPCLLAKDDETYGYNHRINQLEGICPDAIERLQDKQFMLDVTRVLRNMKAAPQAEAVELMVASNTIAVAHANALLKAMPPKQRTDFKRTERDRSWRPLIRSSNSRRN